MRLLKKLFAAKSQKRHRRQTLFSEFLENRELLTGVSWLGQTGADHVGPWSELRPSNVQDIQLKLTDLPLDKSIDRAVVQGYGADRWEYGGLAGSWLIDVVRNTGDASADLYFEPAREETGRQFNIGLTYSDGTFEEVYFQGGVADPSLKPPGQELQAQWLGAVKGVDLTSPSARIGPDGVTDLQISLSQINTNKRLAAIDVVDSDNTWVASYSTNASRVGTMEFSPDAADASRGTVTFSNPAKALIGPLKVQIRYSDGTGEEVPCPMGPVATSPVVMPASPLLTNSGATAAWQGQVVTNPARPGWVRVAVVNMPVSGISAWQVSDTTGQSWLWTISGTGSPWPQVYNQKPMAALRDSATGQWILEFDSRTDLTGVPISIMAASDMGRMYGIGLTGGFVDPTKLAAIPALTSITALPGDDLQAIVNQYGTVNLSPGVYNLSKPLVLARPVNLVGTAGAVLNFQQPAESPGWSTVITLAAGNTRLSGFRVQFSGPVKWLDHIRFGPAVIGSPDNFNTTVGRFGPLVGLTIENLDLQGPPPSAYLEESPRLVRLIDDTSGVIRNNTLYGGWVEVTGGPWSITGNNLTGVWPTAFSYDGFAAHDVTGLKFSDNKVQRAGDSGVIFRLIVVNGHSSGVEISNNQSIGLGASVADPWQMQQTNAHEVILTEAYRVNYEGGLYGIDASKSIIQVGPAIGPAYQPGDYVAVLDGASSGTWRVVTSVVNGNTLVLNAPLPQWVGRGTTVSINRGIMNVSITGNLIDQRDRPVSLGSVLVGNLYGLNYSGNTILGGLRGLQVIAYPSETPRDWGWTRNVVFDTTISQNTFSDVLWFNQLGVSHSSVARANYGHLYLTAAFLNNTFAWSADFLTKQIGQRNGDSGLLLPGLEVGEGGPWDDTEARLSISNNQIILPDGWANRPAIWYRSGTVNGQAAADQLITLPQAARPAAPAGLMLVNDSGISSTDKITNDSRLQLTPVTGLNYEFRPNANSVWQTITSPVQWSPAGLVEGANTVQVRAVDRFGQQSDATALTFVVDTTAPSAPAALTLASFDTLSWQVSASSDVSSQAVTFRNAKYTSVSTLLPAVNRLSPEKWTTGTNTAEIVAIDVAGNRSAAVSAAFQYATSGSWGGQDGSDFASLSRTLTPDGKQDIRLDIQGLAFGPTLSGLTVSGFGGGNWAWPTAPAGSYAAAWRPAASGRSGAIYFQTNRTETGRPFFVTLKFSDSTSTSFWVTGGKANPNLPASGGGSGTIGATSLQSNIQKPTKPIVKKPVPRAPVKMLNNSRVAQAANK